MGGRSSSANSTTSQAFDNRVMNQNDNRQYHETRNETDSRQYFENRTETNNNIDNSVRNETDSRQYFESRTETNNNIDNSVRNETDSRQYFESRTEVGDGAIVTEGNVTISTLDGDIAQAAIEAVTNAENNALAASEAVRIAELENQQNSIADAFSFAGNISEGLEDITSSLIDRTFDANQNSLNASSDALSQAFNSTAGGVVEAGRDFIKFGGIGTVLLIAFITYTNRK